MKNSYLLFFIIFLSGASGYLSIDLYLPSLPALAKIYHVTSGIAQRSVTVFLLSFCVSQLFYGPAADRFGRKIILLIGFAIYTIGGFLCVSTSDINILLLGRFIQGLGIGAGATLSRVMLRDMCEGAALARIMSYLNCAVIAALTLAPGVGGVLQTAFGYRANFGVMAFLGLLGFIATACYQKPREINSVKTSMISGFSDTPRLSHNYVSLLKDPVFMLFALQAGVTVSIIIVFSISNPFILQNHLGLSPLVYGFCAFLIAFFELLSSLINGKLVGSLGIHKMMIIGIGCILLGSILMCFRLILLPLYPIFAILFASSILAVGVGIMMPNVSTQAFSRYSVSLGTVGALYGFIQMLFVSATSFLVSLYAKTSQESAGIILLILCVISALIYVFNLRGDLR